MAGQQVPPRGIFETPEMYQLRLAAAGVKVPGNPRQMPAPRTNFLSQQAQARPQSRPQAQPQPAFSWTGPQRGAETDANHAIRQALAYGGTELAKVFDPLGSRSVTPSNNFIFGTPDQRKSQAAQATATRALAPRTAQPGNSFRDPAWDGLEAKAEKEFGLPPGSLNAIRTKGERSNGDQVSSAGARTVYQIIPATAEGVRKNYGINAYGSPQEQARAAAAILSEGYKRTGTIAGAVQQYHGGTNPANYGPINSAYIARVLGGVEQAGGLVSPFDPSYLQQADAALQQGAAAAMTPTSIEQQVAEAPMQPDLVTAPRTDFSKVDAAVEALKPAEMSEKEQLAIRRRGWMAGIGQALMSLPDGAGLGKVLAAVGGGAMMGAARGDEELMQRQDRLDAKMAQYNVAVLNNEQTKAATLSREVANETAVLNQNALNKWQTAYQEFQGRNGPPQITSQGFVINSFDPKTRKQTTKLVPIASSVMAGYQSARAGLMQQAFQTQNSLAGQTAGQWNGFVLGLAGNAALAGQDGGEDAMLQAPGFLAGQVTQRGLAGAVIGKQEDYEALVEEAQQSARTLGLMPGNERYEDHVASYVGSQITMLAASDESTMKRLLQYGGVAAQGWAADRQADKFSRTTRTDPSGRTTTTTKE